MGATNRTRVDTWLPQEAIEYQEFAQEEFDMYAEVLRLYQNCSLNTVRRQIILLQIRQLSNYKDYEIIRDTLEMNQKYPVMNGANYNAGDIHSQLKRQGL